MIEFLESLEIGVKWWRRERITEWSYSFYLSAMSRWTKCLLGKRIKTTATTLFLRVRQSTPSPLRYKQRTNDNDLQPTNNNTKKKRRTCSLVPFTFKRSPLFIHYAHSYQINHFTRLLSISRIRLFVSFWPSWLVSPPPFFQPFLIWRAKQPATDTFPIDISSPLKQNYPCCYFQVTNEFDPFFLFSSLYFQKDVCQLAPSTEKRKKRNSNSDLRAKGRSLQSKRGPFSRHYCLYPFLSIPQCISEGLELKWDPRQTGLRLRDKVQGANKSGCRW